MDSASEADSYSARMPTRLAWLPLALGKYAREPLFECEAYSWVGENGETVESIVFVRLESGVGRDMSGGESAVISAKGSMKVEWVNARRGGILDCFSTGCAHVGILISTCLALPLSTPDVSSRLGKDGRWVVAGESLVLE